MPIRIVVVDDHPIVLQGLENLFQRQRDIQVVACADNADTALDLIREERPDVALVDLRMPGRSGLDLLRTMAAEKLECRSILLTATISADEVREALNLGVSGLVLKDSTPENLLACVRRVSQGGHWVDQDTATQALQAAIGRGPLSTSPGHTLTPREMEIVAMVAEGLRNRAIAQRLTISEGTVKVHLHNIYEKLNVDGRVALLRCARDRGLL